MELRFNSKRLGQIAGRRLGAITDGLNSSYERLASGSRMPRAGDDASGLGQRESARARLRGMSSARGNIQDGLSMVETASSGLRDVGDSLARMRELAVRAASGTLADEDRSTLNAEFQGQREGIDQIASQTSFNGQQLLDGTAGPTVIQTGTDSGDVITVEMPDATSASLGDLQDLDLSTAASASAALEDIDAAIETIRAQETELGVTRHRLQSADRSLQASSMSLARTESRISDADLATEVASLMRERIAQKAAVSVMAQATIEPDRALELLGIAPRTRRSR